ncbi:MAG: hypothetical protein JXB23_08070 [Candidatus Aminicenantes bacterium]|nr:hypothetical protein [Candidatus Aminicenantes bacterium]
MRLKSVFICLAIFLLSMCSSAPKGGQEYVSQYSVRYENVSRDEIWTASLKSIQDIQFTIRREIEDKGLIDALDEKGSTPESSPPIMSVMLIEEEGKIKVNCLVVCSGRIAEPAEIQDYVAQFFDALNKNLENDAP